MFKNYIEHLSKTTLLLMISTLINLERETVHKVDCIEVQGNASCFAFSAIV